MVNKLKDEDSFDQIQSLHIFLLGIKILQVNTNSWSTQAFHPQLL